MLAPLSSGSASHDGIAWVVSRYLTMNGEKFGQVIRQKATNSMFGSWLFP